MEFESVLVVYFPSKHTVKAVGSVICCYVTDMGSDEASTEAAAATSAAAQENGRTQGEVLGGSIRRRRSGRSRQWLNGEKNVEKEVDKSPSALSLVRRRSGPGDEDDSLQHLR